MVFLKFVRFNGYKAFLAQFGNIGPAQTRQD